MVVNTAEERSRRILANHLRDEMATTRVLVHERSDVVDEAGNDHKRALHRLLLLSFDSGPSPIQTNLGVLTTHRPYPYTLTYLLRNEQKNGANIASGYAYTAGRLEQNIRD